MIMRNDPPSEAWNDPFRPPATPCRVRCLHCGREYLSSQMVWHRYVGGDGCWSCPVPDCDAVGFGLDIFPLDSPVWLEEEEPETASDEWVECDPDEDTDELSYDPNISWQRENEAGPDGDAEPPW